MPVPREPRPIRRPMSSMMHPRILIPLALVAVAGTAAAAPVRRPAAKPAPRPASSAPRPAAAPSLTSASLGAALKGLGYEPKAEGQYQRVKVDEGQFVYAIDLSLSGSGDWLVCMAHLAPIEDLTKVPASPLLSLLATND